MPDSVQGGERRGDRLTPTPGETIALVEPTAAPLSAGPALTGAALETRVGRLHARYRLDLEAKRPPPAPGEIRKGPDSGPLAPFSLLARLARITGLARASDRQPPLVVQHTLAIEGLAAALDGMTLAHVSDLHLDHCDGVCVDAVAAATASQASDALIITGDLFTSALAPSRAERPLNALAEILDRHGGPAFAVLGDEDSLWAVPRMEQLGLRVLVNESVALGYGGDRLYLAGVDDPAYFKADDMDAALQCIPQGANSLLLAHAPDIYRRAARAGFDAMLCGHTHGGQVCLPNGKPLVRAGSAPSEVSRGSWRHRQMAGYTSAGSGATPLRLRLNCPAEVIFHRLTKR